MYKADEKAHQSCEQVLGLGVQLPLQHSSDRPCISDSLCDSGSGSSDEEDVSVKICIGI